MRRLTLALLIVLLGWDVSTFGSLNAMATARQKGGLRTASGDREIYGFANYVLGFQTGFDSEAQGVHDIFSSFGSSPAFTVLYAIEPWCAGHPYKAFGTAVLSLAKTLQEKHE